MPCGCARASSKGGTQGWALPTLKVMLCQKTLTKGIQLSKPDWADPPPLEATYNLDGDYMVDFLAHPLPCSVLAL